MLFSSPDIAAQKAHLRHEMKARRAQLDEKARARAAWLACDALSYWLAERPERAIAVFLARPCEICLDSLIGELLKSKYIVAAPRVEVDAQIMKFWRLDDLDATQSGAWGVREPVSTEEIAPEIVLVPGLAFDPSGQRLGTGGGWYDRVLSESVVKVGVAFAAQIVPRVPIETHDIAVDWIVSEDEVRRCG